MSDVAVKERPTITPESFDRLLQEYQQAKAYREAKIEKRWQDAITLAWPRFGEYGNDPVWADARYDGTATESISLVGDALYGNLCSAGTQWFRYQFTEQSLNRSKQGRAALEKLTEHMADVFRRSTFYDVAPEYLQSCVAIASTTMDVQEDEAEQRIICRVDHPRGLYFATNSRNRVETIYQRVWLTIEQAIDKWGEGKIPIELLTIHKTAPSSALYEFLNIIKRRKAGSWSSRITKEMPYASCWLWPGEPRKTLIEESGYRTFPKPTWRWSTRGNDPYGWGLTDDNMPDIRSLNSYGKAHMIADQRASDPAKFVPEEGRSWSDAPGARNTYRDPNRKPYYWETTGQFRFNDKEYDKRTERVRQGYKTNHFLMLIQQDKGDMTAREVLERKKEQAAVTGSPTSKAETEGFDGIHQRFLQIELDSGRLRQVFPNGLPQGLLSVEYLGPLSQLRKEVQAQEGIMGALELVAPIWQIAPETRHRIKPIVIVDRILGSKQFPEDAIASDREYAAKLQEEADKAAQIQANLLAQEAAKGVDPNQMPQAGSPAMQLMQRSA